MKARVGDEAKIFWLDASYRDDLTLKQIQELVPAKAITRGRLMVLSSDWITVASSEFPGGGGEPDEYRAIVCIPRSVISRVVRLKEVK